MNIGNVNGKGGIDRSSDRPARVEGKRNQAPSRSQPLDEASISERGREVARSAEALTQRARQEDPDRQAMVEAARQKLNSGELDSVAVQRETAQRLLDSNFSSLV